MTDSPVVWHYGLMAERWAECLTDAPELPFFRKAIGRFGQPVLDLDCGTGGLLMPPLCDGIDIDGCDSSGDVLRHLRSTAAIEGPYPQVSEQQMHIFALPWKYRTIYICGSFGLVGGRDQDLDTLRRCYAHHDDDGALVRNIQAEYTSPKSWDVWATGARATMPEPWPDGGARCFRL